MEFAFSRWRRALARFGWIVCIALRAQARDAIQFDLFFGFEQVAREGCWFPVTCEVQNDGPSFKGTIEIRSGDQIRRVPVELPTNTRKRIGLILFNGDRSGQWDASLLDDRGKVRAEQGSVQLRTLLWEGTLLVATPRSFSSAPAFPPLSTVNRSLALQVPRLPVEQFPDNPIALEAVSALYLNSEKALDLKPSQINALLTWMNEGGHLILAPEQIADINSTPWLKKLFPFELEDLANFPAGSALEDWAKRRRPLARPATAYFPGQRPVMPGIVSDSQFANSVLAVATGKEASGRTILEAGGHPLVVEERVGRGRITALLFNPEKEPFRSWKNRGWFWAKLTDLPVERYLSNEFIGYGGWSIDSVLGALLDTDQVHKLPVQWLLALLVVYLLVIGPFDYFWLKRINRQMLTWITFPGYVVAFSLLIYLIGYKLRAGVNEWNELNIVDIFPRGQRADVRGYTFASIYSSANSTFPLANEQGFAALRTELGSFNGARQGPRIQSDQRGNGFRAGVYVPVWTSVLVASDWQDSGPLPLKASVAQDGQEWAVKVENSLNRPLSDCRLVVNGNLYSLGTVEPNQAKTFRVRMDQGIRLANFLQQRGGRFLAAAQQRSSPLGRDRFAHLTDPVDTAVSISFPSQLQTLQPNQRGFVYPPRFDLTPATETSQAVLLAFDANHSFGRVLPQFTPPRRHQNTLFRLAIPIQ